MESQASINSVNSVATTQRMSERWQEFSKYIVLTLSPVIIYAMYHVIWSIIMHPITFFSLLGIAVLIGFFGESVIQHNLLYPAQGDGGVMSQSSGLRVTSRHYPVSSQEVGFQSKSQSRRDLLSSTGLTVNEADNLINNNNPTLRGILRARSKSKSGTKMVSINNNTNWENSATVGIYDDDFRNTQLQIPTDDLPAQILTREVPNCDPQWMVGPIVNVTNPLALTFPGDEQDGTDELADLADRFTLIEPPEVEADWYGAEEFTEFVPAIKAKVSSTDLTKDKTEETVSPTKEQEGEGDNQQDKPQQSDDVSVIYAPSELSSPTTLSEDFYPTYRDISEFLGLDIGRQSEPTANVPENNNPKY